MTTALSCALQATSADCVEMLASHMARRRKNFFSRSSLNKISVQSSSLPASLRVALRPGASNTQPKANNSAVVRKINQLCRCPMSRTSHGPHSCSAPAVGACIRGHIPPSGTCPGLLPHIQQAWLLRVQRAQSVRGAGEHGRVHRTIGHLTWP